MVTVIIVMMKGYYKNAGYKEKQRQAYKNSTISFTQHLFP